MDSASAIGRPVREPETGGNGSLAPLGRKALMPRLTRIASALSVRERLQVTAHSAEEDWRDAFAPGVSARAGSRHTAGMPYTPARQLASGEPRREEGTDSRALREVQLELRGLRAEIGQLSRALGFTSRESNRVEYKGILQQQDPLDSDVRLLRWREEDHKAREGVERALRQREARRLEQQRQELLRALTRAEQRLSEVPQTAVPLLRNAVIGEIIRARYDIAFFGGLSGTALTGMQYDLAA